MSITLSHSRLSRFFFFPLNFIYVGCCQFAFDFIAKNLLIEYVGWDVKVWGFLESELVSNILYCYGYFNISNSWLNRPITSYGCIQIKLNDFLFMNPLMVTSDKEHKLTIFECLHNFLRGLWVVVQSEIAFFVKDGAGFHSILIGYYFGCHCWKCDERFWVVESSLLEKFCRETKVFLLRTSLIMNT